MKPSVIFLNYKFTPVTTLNVIVKNFACKNEQTALLVKYLSAKCCYLLPFYKLPLHFKKFTKSFSYHYCYLLKAIYRNCTCKNIIDQVSVLRTAHPLHDALVLNAYMGTFVQLHTFLKKIFCSSHGRSVNSIFGINGNLLPL